MYPWWLTFLILPIAIVLFRIRPEIWKILIVNLVRVLQRATDAATLVIATYCSCGNAMHVFFSSGTMLSRSYPVQCACLMDNNHDAIDHNARKLMAKVAI